MSKRTRHILDEALEPRLQFAGPPSANAGGPYAVNEGSSIALAGSSTGTIVSWAWDFQYSSTTGFQSDATGRTPTFSASTLDGPSTRTIALRVTDDRGRTSLATTTIGVQNVAPQATFGLSTSSIYTGQPADATFTAPLDSPADLAALTYLFDFNNDGVFEVNAGATPNAAIPSAQRNQPGQHTVRGRVLDKDGAKTDYSATLEVRAPSLVLDPFTVPEGQSLTLTIAHTEGTNGDFAWDLEYDGTTFDMMGFGSTFEFVWGFDGPTVFHPAVRATDAAGNTIITTTTLTVTNVAPNLYIDAPSVAAEGSEVWVYSTATDPSLPDATYMTREFDFNSDGIVDATLPSTFGAYMPIPPEMLDDGPGTLTITVRAIDDDGGVDTKTKTLTIINQAPTGRAAVDPTDAGIATTARILDVVEPSAADRASLKFSFDFTNDGVWDVVDSPTPTATIPGSVLAAAGTYRLVVRIADKDGGVTLDGINYDVSPGTTANFAWSGGFLDEGYSLQVYDTHTMSAYATLVSLEWDFDFDGTTFTIDSTTPNAYTPPLDGPATRVVALRITDSAGTVAMKTATYTVRNIAPQSATRSWSTTLVERATSGFVRLDGLSDPGPGELATLRFDYDFDNDGTFDLLDSPSNTASIPASFVPDGPGAFTVKARVRDKDGGFNDYLMPIAVTNAAPTITLNGTGDLKTIRIGTPFTLNIAVTDPGDTVSKIEIAWGDSTTFDTVLGPGEFSATHTYTGNQRSAILAVRVTDEDGSYTTTRQVLLDGPPTVARSTFDIDAAQTPGNFPGRGPRLQLSFNESLGTSLTADDLVLQNLTTGQTIPTTAGSLGLVFSGSQGFGAWRWPTGLPDGRYRATLPAGSVADSGGQTLASDFNIEFFILAGDANHDAIVNFDDLLILAQNYGLTGKSFNQGDFNFSADGKVDFDDLLMLTQHYGVSTVTASQSIAAETKPAPKRKPKTNTLIE